MAVRLEELPFPTNGATSKLAWFGATLLLATPSDLDLIKDHSEVDIRAFLTAASITGGLQDDLVKFIQAVADDPVIRQQMQDLQSSLLNSPTTRAVYDQTICPKAPASTEILKRLAQPFP